MSYRYALHPVAVCLLAGLLQQYAGVYGNPRTDCNIRKWYVDMLADGYLMDAVTDEQNIAKSEIEAMLKRAKLNNNDMVKCELLNSYHNIFVTQKTIPDEKEGTENEDRHDSIDGDDKDLNIVIDDTEFGDEIELNSEDTVMDNIITESKGNEENQLTYKDLSITSPEERKPQHKKIVIKKKKRKIKRDNGDMHISSLVWGVCFPDKCFVLQHFLEMKQTDPVKANITKHKRTKHRNLRNVSNQCNFKNHCSSHCYYITVFKKFQCFPQYSLENTTSDKVNLTKESSTDNTIQELMTVEDASIAEPIEQREVKDVQKPVQKLQSTNAQQNNGDAIVHTESLSEKTNGLNVEASTEKQPNCQNSPYPNFDFVKFEQQFMLKSNEYETKIQSLEIMIVRLENKLLSEKLTQKNDTGSFTKLENQILKVENELLKLNQSYFMLREENEMLKKRQGKYLELAYVKSQTSDNTNITKQHEMISQQHLKITHLKTVLQNHSDMFEKFKRQHSLLEEQNQILHQIVMNQTAIISNIMKKMQEIADDNNKQRQETQSLKAKLDIEATSNHILEKFAHLVSDKIPAVFNEVKDGKTEVKANLEIREFLPHFPTPLIDKNTNWQCQGNRSPRFCLLYSVILSPCPPFSPIYWRKCHFRWSRIPDDTPSQSNPSQELNLEPHIDVSKKHQPHIGNAKDKQQVQTEKESKIIADPNISKLSSLIPSDGLRTETSNSEQNMKENIDQEQNTNKKDEKSDRKDKKMVGKDKSMGEKDKQDKKRVNMGEKDITIEEKDNKLDQKSVKTGVKDKLIQTDIKLGERNNKLDQKVVNVDQKVGKEEQKVVKEKKKQKVVKEKQKIVKEKQKVVKEDPKSVKEDPKSVKETQKYVEKLDKKDFKTGENNKKLSGKDLQMIQTGVDTGKKETKTDTLSDKKTSESKHEVSATEKKDGKKGVDIQAESKKKIKEDSNKTPPSAEKEKPNSTGKPHTILYTTEWGDKPKDCYSLYESGHSLNRMYRVYLPGSRQQIPVLCDMRKGGWTVILKRMDGSVGFNRDWDDYKTGFGGVYTEHWIGNDNLHYLTNQDHYTLRVELTDWERQRRFAEYDVFWVEDEDANYRLHIGGYSGDAGDGFLRHTDMMFSTYDKDNDLLKETQMGGSCAKRFKAGGWFYRCYNNNVFGIYYQNEKIPEKHFDGITWKPWKGPNNSMKEIVFKIRPRNARDL